MPPLARRLYRYAHESQSSALGGNGFSERRGLRRASSERRSEIACHRGLHDARWDRGCVESRCRPRETSRRADCVGSAGSRTHSATSRSAANLSSVFGAAVLRSGSQRGCHGSAGHDSYLAVPGSRAVAETSSGPALADRHRRQHSLVEEKGTQDGAVAADAGASCCFRERRRERKH